MALLRYLTKSEASVLPNPEGPLSQHMPSSSIDSTNKEVKRLVDASSKKDSGIRGKYAVYTEEEKLKKAKRAAEMGANQYNPALSKGVCRMPTERKYCPYLDE